MVMVEKFGINNAYSIARILIACGVIEESDLMETVDKIIDGTFQLRNENESKKSKKEKSSKKEVIS